MLGQIILIVDDDPLVAGSLAEALESAERRIILCADADAAAVVLERHPVSLVLTDIRMTQPFGYEGLDLLRQVSAMQESPGVVVMTGLRDPEIDPFVRKLGASMLLQKPFAIDQIESFLSRCPDFKLPRELERAPHVLEFPDLDTVIASAELVSAFQPIIDLRSGSVAAIEALTRYRASAPWNDISLLLDYSERRERIVDFNLELVSRSLAASAALAGRLPLFINVHPAILGEPDRLIPSLILRANRCRVPLHSLVIEITEHAALPQHAKVIESLEALREAGVRFALDDVGSAHSHLSWIEEIQPSFLKISQEFGTDFERHPARARIVRNIFRLGDDFGLDVILEGIESAETAAAARELGIGLAQGYYFARPGSLADVLELVEVAA